MKQGGSSKNGNVNAKKGMGTNASCSVCGRRYAQDWTRNNHERLCKEYHARGELK